MMTSNYKDINCSSLPETDETGYCALPSKGSFFSQSRTRASMCLYKYKCTHIYIHISIYAHVHLNTCSVHLLTQALC